jgi:DNA-binding LytR/AlgR family response regulator
MIVELKEMKDIKETVVEILCKAIDEDILKLERHVRLFSKTLVAKCNGDFVPVLATDIYYIETVDRKTLVYTENNVLETDFRLYELEERLEDCSFIRVSKSIILNLQKVSVLAPEINRMMLATMKNGEKIYISRQYAKSLKAILTKTNAGRESKK